MITPFFCRQGCPKDSLTIYKTVDGSGYPKWHSRCGSGSDMSIIMDGNVAYVKYVTDGENRYEGKRGFYATFNVEGQLKYSLHFTSILNHFHFNGKLLKTLLK